MLLKSIIVSLCVLSCTGVPHMRLFGNVVKKHLDKYAFLGSQKISKLPDGMKENKANFVFPKDQDEHTNFVIKGIQEVDLTSDQPKVNFIDGGVDSKEAIIEVTAPHKEAEINSEFQFYGLKYLRDPRENLVPWNKFVVPELEKPLEPEMPLRVTLLNPSQKPLIESEIPVKPTPKPHILSDNIHKP